MNDTLQQPAIQARPTAATSGVPSPYQPDATRVLRAIARRSVATIATTSPSYRSHAATVIYQAVDEVLYVSTLRSSRKARNIADCPDVAMTILVRRLPIGPPSTIMFQSKATLLSSDHPEITQLAGAGQLDNITGHGELDLPDGCFVRIPLPPRLLTHGIGMSLRRLIADPLGAGGQIVLPRRGTGAQETVEELADGISVISRDVVFTEEQ